ncbi:MAG TPA: LLM class flavin-dependent oxidoreductase [Jiangellaceae bacterium]|nr:LLM class flavin-dependent oxidoreductase [Jiangellaceae bacterium]
MKYGFVLPQGDARTAAETAAEAEQAGWDAFFVWEPVWGIDARVCLTAAAMRTERIRLGTMLTPLSRMRPWKLASETATLDNLSGGRVILSVGLGAIDSGFEEFGEVTDRRVRAELLDEGLAILTGLWAGQPFSHQSTHYTIRPTTFMPPPPPVQRPRIPIWVVGVGATEVDGSGSSLRGPAPPRRQAHPRARRTNAGRRRGRRHLVDRVALGLRRRPRQGARACARGAPPS